MAVTTLDGQKAGRPAEAGPPQDLAPLISRQGPRLQQRPPYVVTQMPQPVLSLAQTQLWSWVLSEVVEALVWGWSLAVAPSGLTSSLQG